jgi:hypothetical protein
MSRKAKHRAARERERLKLTPKAVRRYVAFRECAEGLKPIVRSAEEDMIDLIHDLTGGGTIDDLPAAKRLLVESALQTVVASRAMFAIFIETRDPELASRMATQATTLHRALTTLGLDRISREIDLGTYLATKDTENRAQRANGDTPNNDSAGASFVPPAAHGGGDGDGEVARSAPLVVLNPSSDHEEETDR